MQGVSLPPPAAITHKEELNKMRMNEADREAHGFRCKLRLEYAKIFMVHGNKPDAACMDEIEGEKEQGTGNITPPL